MKDLFVDRLMNISILQGVARLDFARVDEVNAKDKTAKMSPSYRIAMPIDALDALLKQAGKTLEEMKQMRDKELPGSDTV